MSSLSSVVVSLCLAACPSSSSDYDDSDLFPGGSFTPRIEDFHHSIEAWYNPSLPIAGPDPATTWQSRLVYLLTVLNAEGREWEENERLVVQRAAELCAVVQSMLRSSEPGHFELPHLGWWEFRDIAELSALMAIREEKIK